ncbi:MAG: FadR/GntR family transcriptional regulator [Sandaracinaceae bacterium]
MSPRVRAASAVDRCERTLRRAILSGSLPPGARLPPEREHAEQLAVNRTTLRAALSRLASAKLVSVRQGSGYVVLDYRRHAGLEVLSELAEIAEAEGRAPFALIRDVLELRRRLAQMALERIAAREGHVDTRPLEAAIDAFEAHQDDTSDELARCDLACTAEVLALTGSEVMGLLLNPIGTLIHSLAPLREAIYRDPRSNVRGYRALLAWLDTRSHAALPLVLGELERRDADTLTWITGST